MNLSELTKSLTSYIYERATSPFLWVFFACFIADHWDDVLVLLFSNKDIYHRIDYITDNIKTATILGSESSSYYYVISPLISAIIITLLYPVLTIFASAIFDFSLTARNNISQFFDSHKFLTKSDTLEFKNERAELIETFNKQLQESQKQLRESQQQFAYSQSNCAALFCALGFAKGQESLLPYSDLFSDFVARNTEQRDMLVGFGALRPNNAGGRQDITLADLLKEIREINFLPALKEMSDTELSNIVQDLIDNGAILPTYRRTGGGGRDQLKTDTTIALTTRGRKFVSSMNAIRNSNFQHALNIQQI